MRLFKFVDFRGVDILRNERIKFTLPQEFKDPFEMQLGIDTGTAKRQVKQLLVELEKQACREISGYGDISHRQRKKGRRNMVKTSETVALFRESFLKGTKNQSTEKIGILSLCEFHDSNLMWYHYADGHKGFVIEFDGDNEEFRKLGKSFKVDYVHKPPVYNDTKPPPEFFRFKPNYLLHENEYRIVQFLQDCKHEKGEKDLTLYFRNLPRKSVKAVYLGHRMEKSVREEVLQLLKGMEAAKFDAIPSQEDYKLLFREITN
jgi:hypothetical protein